MYKYGTRYNIYDRKLIWRIIYDCLLYAMCDVHVSPLWAINTNVCVKIIFTKIINFSWISTYFLRLISSFLTYLRYAHRHHHHSPLIMTNYFKRFGLTNWLIIFTNVNLFSLFIWLFDNIKRFRVNYSITKYK